MKSKQRLAIAICAVGFRRGLRRKAEAAPAARGGWPPKTIDRVQVALSTESWKKKQRALHKHKAFGAAASRPMTGRCSRAAGYILHVRKLDCENENVKNAGEAGAAWHGERTEVSPVYRTVGTAGRWLPLHPRYPIFLFF